MTMALEFKSNLGPHPQYPKSVKAGIPKLPYPKNGWKTIFIGELFTIANRPVELKDNGNYRLVTVKRSRGGVTKREQLQGREIAVKSQFYVREGDFLISKRQIVHGACGFVPPELDGSIVSNEYTVLNCSDVILPQFLNYLMHTPYFQQTCFHSSIGVHVEKMIFKLEAWFKWKINIPGHKEQQKIAAFLSAVDDKLTNLRRKRELLESYKSGLMQQLFSQQIRFKQDDGSDFPDWQQTKMGELGVFKSGVGFPELEQGGKEGIPFFKVSDMNLPGNEKAMFRFNNAVTSDQIQKLKLKPIKQKSYIFAKVGAAIFLERKRKAENFLIDNNMMAFTPNHYLDYNFTAYLLERTKLSRYAQTGALPSYNGSDLRIIKMEIPSKTEQQKIADFLQSVDKKIDAVAEQITQLESFKKGLLQKLFV